MKFVATITSMLFLNSITSSTCYAEKVKKSHRQRMQFQNPSPLLTASHADVLVEDESFDNHRSLKEKERQPLRIKFYTQPLLDAITNADTLTKARGNAIIEQVLPSIESLWKNSLSIYPSNSNIVLPDDVCFGLYDFPKEWSSSKTGVANADLVIFVSAMTVIGTTQICSSDAALSTLAVSSPCAVDPDTDRPVVGFANVCLNTLATGMNGQIDEGSIQTMIDVMSHELVHVLGLNSELYKYFRNSKTGSALTPRKRRFLGKNGGFDTTENVECVGDQPPKDIALACSNTVKYKEEMVMFGNEEVSRGYYEVVTPTVAQVAKNHFNCPSLQGARLENQPTSEDCFGSHFDERTWFTEFMSAVYDEDAAYFSPLTLAFLEDTGWYKANFKFAENSPFGLGAGCSFVEDDCIVNGGEVPDYGKGFFCNDVESSEWSCGPSANFRGKCDIKSYTHPKRNYFDTLHIGPSFTHADYCPLVVSNAQDCDDVYGLKLHAVEVFGKGSKCMDVTKSTGKSALCLKGSCNQNTKSYDFEVENKILSCTKDFEEISVEMYGETMLFQCPRLTQVCPNMFCPSMCSGKGECDWSSPTPTCKCFDENDKTDGCYESEVIEQAVCPSSAASYIPWATVITFLVPIVATAQLIF